MQGNCELWCLLQQAMLFHINLCIICHLFTNDVSSNDTYNYTSISKYTFFTFILHPMLHDGTSYEPDRLKWMSLSGLVRGWQISWWTPDEGMFFFFFPSPPASEYASFQCAICCLIWLPPLQHVCPGAGEIGNKSFACISCLFDPAAHFCLMKLDFNSKCHSQSWQSLLFWSITRVLSEKHSGFSDYLLRGEKKLARRYVWSWWFW